MNWVIMSVMFFDLHNKEFKEETSLKIFLSQKVNGLPTDCPKVVSPSFRVYCLIVQT